MEGIVTEY